MYCVDDRSWRVGSETTRLRYSANDSTRRLRVKSSRTAEPSSTSKSLTTEEPAEEPPAEEPPMEEPVEVGVSAITMNVSPTQEPGVSLAETRRRLRAGMIGRTQSRWHLAS